MVNLPRSGLLEQPLAADRVPQRLKRSVGIPKTEGELETHFHATFSNEKKEVYGGHLVKGKNPTLATIDLSIIEVKGVKLGKKFDEETGFVLMSSESI